MKKIVELGIRKKEIFEIGSGNESQVAFFVIETGIRSGAQF